MSADGSEGVDWKTALPLINSTHRRTVATELNDRGPSTPSTLAEHVDLSSGNVSRALRQLQDEGLVELLVPEDTRKGRVYGLTGTGERAATALNEVAT